MELDQVQGLSMQDKTSRGRLYYFWYWTIKRYFCIRCCPRRHSTTRYLCLTKYIDTVRLPFLHKVPISSNDSGIELCVVHPDIQKSLWNSVVQITIDDTAGSLSFFIRNEGSRVIKLVFQGHRSILAPLYQYSRAFSCKVEKCNRDYSLVEEPGFKDIF